MDQLETADKYPDLFSVSLDVIVSPNERPRTDSMYPWQKFDTQKLNPRVLFSSKDELYQVLNEFGKLYYQDILIIIVILNSLFKRGRHIYNIVVFSEALTYKLQ